MKRTISLAYLTVPGIEPLEQIELAARAGYDCVSLRTISMGQEGEPQICLEKDPGLFRKIRAALRDTGLSLFDIELVRIREDLPTDYRRAFECGAKLGAKEVLSSVWTSDHALAVERYGAICEQAREFGLNMNVEFPIVSGMKTLDETVKLQNEVGAPNFKILMDMMYCHWDQVTPEKIRSLSPERFGVIHLCDCPVHTDGRPVVEIVREGREYCGEGAADLKGILKALPENGCSIELPNVRYIREFGAEGHVRNCLAHARTVLEGLG